MKRILLAIVGLLILAIAIVGGFLAANGDAMSTPEFWENEIEAYEAADAERFPDKNLILFAGSSSFRMWATLEKDMAPLGVLNRGFGGAHMSHVLHFADRIIQPYNARAIVLYVGDNDIGAGKTPEIVEADFLTLVAKIRETQPHVPIYFLTIKASRLRWALWPMMDLANDRIVALAKTDPLIRVIDVSAPMVELGEGDKPPSELFKLDGLHLSAEGYALWTEIVRNRLLSDLGSG